MAARQTSPRSLKSITGAILLALGFLILFANLDGVTGQITSAVGTSPEPAQGMLPALALANIAMSCKTTFLITRGFCRVSANLGIILAADPHRHRKQCYCEMYSGADSRRTRPGRALQQWRGVDE